MFAVVLQSDHRRKLTVTLQSINNFNLLGRFGFLQLPYTLCQGLADFDRNLSFKPYHNPEQTSKKFVFVMEDMNSKINSISVKRNQAVPYTVDPVASKLMSNQQPAPFLSVRIRVYVIYFQEEWKIMKIRNSKGIF